MLETFFLYFLLIQKATRQCTKKAGIVNQRYFMGLNIQDISTIMETNPPLHIIGAGGVGMSGLALLLKDLGFVVSSSDKTDGPYIQNLQKSGMNVWIGSKPSNINPSSVIFHSSAVPESDPELTFARRKNMFIFSRHPLLKWITQRYFTIAVAGAHGKTTTSAWIADSFVRAGMDPCALIGGTVREWQSNVRIGGGTYENKKILVLEADESDSSFLAISAKVAVILNIDLDHVDRFSHEEEIKNEYFQFARKTIHNHGTVVLSAEISQSFYNDLKKYPESRIEYFTNEQWSLIVSQLRFGIPGDFNKINFSCVYCLGKVLGIQKEILALSSANFQGVKRRLEIRRRVQWGTDQSLVFIDDYGHHPQEIEQVLITLNKVYDKVIVVWEPHRVSRFLYFKDQFIQVFREHSNGKFRFILPIFLAEDKLSDFPELSLHYQEFQREVKFTKLDPSDINNLTGFIHDEKPDCVIFFGAGSSSDILTRFLTSY